MTAAGLRDVARADADDARERVVRRWFFIVLAATAVGLTLQRGFETHHTTFPIFRQSFHHLVEGRDLYALYPSEQGAEPQDRFKYSPTAALLLAPFAVWSLPVGLLLWNLFNAFALVKVMDRLLPRPDSTIALWLTYPALFHSMQSSSSNGIMAAIIIGAFVFIEGGRLTAGAATVAAGTLFKIFPIAAASFALFTPRRWRFGSLLAAALLIGLALPLLVTPPETLLAQFASWRTMLSTDAGDLLFGDSVMRLARVALHEPFQNWPMQLFGAGLLMLPVALRPHQWGERKFRELFLASLLVFVVIFNHQAEHPSFVIAAAGVSIWIVQSRVSALRVIVFGLCLASIEPVGYAMAWLLMQMDLLGLRLPRMESATSEYETALMN